ncbi:3TM-type holin [Ekhidna sp.]|jgi:hypothetical protein|uniref:3TM-type holin n=1 Tax=Ekhidna sp. TaxID=2608089 RepID=UPI0032EDDD1A
MSFLSKIFGGGEAAAKPINAVGNILDNLFTSKEEKLSHEQAMAKLEQMPDLVQMEINKIEAQHRSIFVAGWRPFVGWVCGTALAYNYIFRDLIAWAINVWSPGTPLPPNLAMEHLMTILGGMLGLGLYRTIEKSKRVAK